MSHDDLPPLHATLLPPRSDDWARITQRVRRRHRARALGAAAAVALVAAVPLSLAAGGIGGQDRVQPPSQVGAGVRTWDAASLRRDHVPGDVVYPDEQRVPPAGGPHAPTPQACGHYPRVIPDENAVHSLEHGAVWITYRPDLPPVDVERLQGVIEAAGEYGLLSPRVQAPLVVATAWGRQLTTEDPQDPAVEEFVEQYVQGPQTPEPGALCVGSAAQEETELPECEASTTGFDILTDGRPDGATPEEAATAYATRRGNGASFPLPPDRWRLLAGAGDTRSVISGDAVLELLATRGGWAVTGGRRCVP